jgi:DNA topoisomerase-2
MLIFSLLTIAVDKSGIVENLLSWAEFKLKKDLKKTDGTKRSNILGIPKLDDANDAGGKESHKCTLILTEGDSAKALAVSNANLSNVILYTFFCHTERICMF